MTEKAAQDESIPYYGLLSLFPQGFYQEPHFIAMKILKNGLKGK